jgi:hypothetical protein
MITQSEMDVYSDFPDSGDITQIGGVEMGTKPEWLKVLMSADIEYPSDAIVALIAFKKTELANKRAGLDAEARRKATIEGMKTLLNVFCMAYNMYPVTFEVGGTPETAEGDGIGYYDSIDRRVILAGRLSIITLLHEFAHAMRSSLGLRTDDTQIEETEARHWSVLLFKKVYPIQYEKNDVSGTGPDDFTMKLPGSHINVMDAVVAA